MKRNRIIKSLVCIFVIGCICYLAYMSWQMIGYLKGVETDVIHKLKSSKEFFVKYSFSGKILEREFCNRENDTIYYVLIKLDSSVILPTFPHDHYYNKYNFDAKNRILKVNVSKEIYDKSGANAIVLKLPISDSISIGGKSFLLLGKDGYEWLPN